MARIPILISSSKKKSDKNENFIVGIDLGTTNSLISYIDNGKPTVLSKSLDESGTIPSVIYFGENTILVGESAKKMLAKDPNNTIFSVKRLMGKSYSDISSQGQFMGYEIIDQKQKGLVKIKVREKYLSPIEMSSLILKELKTLAETRLDKKISKCVITVPAYFDDSQRQATKDAGKLAGLEVLRIINEPTAASLAYGIGLEAGVTKTVAVYDLGGGTFDISILNIDDRVFEVLSTNGDTFLGGDDIDKLIAEYWLKQKAKKLSDLSKNEIQELRLMAESAKKTLSDSANFTANLFGEQYELNISEFESIIKPIVDKTLKCCGSALVDAELTNGDIDEVVMVGGSTRIPLIKSAVRNFFQCSLKNDIDPDEVVSLGAAIHADILAGNRKDMLLLDITPLSLGIETVGGLIDVLIPRNSKIPTRIARQYTTSVDGQKNLKVAIFQGERDCVEDNRKLGEFTLNNIPPMPAGIPKIEIQFLVDVDGIMTVKAKELRSGLEQEITIKSQYGISEEEMALMLKESILNAKKDIEIRALKEAENEGRLIVAATNKFIKQNKNSFSMAEMNQMNSFKIKLEESINSRDKSEINKAIKNLNDYSQPFAHKAMEIAISKSISGKKIGEVENLQ